MICDVFFIAGARPEAAQFLRKTVAAPEEDFIGIAVLIGIINIVVPLMIVREFRQNVFKLAADGGFYLVPAEIAVGIQPVVVRVVGNRKRIILQPVPGIHIKQTAGQIELFELFVESGVMAVSRPHHKFVGLNNIVGSGNISRKDIILFIGIKIIVVYG